MKTLPLLRRTFVLSAAAGALLPMQNALAQAAAADGDWLAMVQAHHALISQTFDQALAAKAGAARNKVLNMLAYQLTAHSIAEENVLYPALAANGLVTESDKLYLDQAHAKVLNASIDMDAMMGAPESAQLTKIKALQTAVLQHAKTDEEGKFYPQLKQKLDARQNAMLTSNYQLQFESVRPVVVV